MVAGVVFGSGVGATPADAAPRWHRVVGDVEGFAGWGSMHSAEGVSLSQDGRLAAVSVYVNVSGIAQQVVTYDTVTRRVTLVSVSDSGREPGDAASRSATISGDGRKVVFLSSAKNIGPKSQRGQEGVKVYLRDLRLRLTKRLFTAVRLERGDSVLGTGLSGDGKWALMFLTGHDGRRYVGKIYRENVATGSVSRVSVDNEGSALDVTRLGDVNTSGQLRGISANGRYVAFVAQPLFSPTLPDAIDDYEAAYLRPSAKVYVRDMTEQRTVAVTVGAGDSRPVGFPVMDGAGSVVVFAVQGGELWRYDVRTGATSRIAGPSPDPGGVNGGDFYPAVTGDGRYVYYESRHEPAAGGGYPPVQLFEHDLRSGTTRVRVGPGRCHEEDPQQWQTNDVEHVAQGGCKSYAAYPSKRGLAASRDGSVVAVATLASRTAGDEPGTPDTYVVSGR